MSSNSTNNNICRVLRERKLFFAGVRSVKLNRKTRFLNFQHQIQQVKTQKIR